MYRRIMVPVDLLHVDKMGKALDTAADLALRWQAELWYVAVTGKVPNRVAKTPEAFAAELEAFTAVQSRTLGLAIQSRTISCVDVPAQLDDTLLTASEEIEADLIVMPSHIPGVPDRLHLISSNAAHIIRHSSLSVFVVR